MAQENLLEMASLHSHPLPDLSSVAALEKDTASSLAEERTMPLPAHQAEHTSCAAALAAPAASLADLLQQLSYLQTQVATLQHHLVRFTLELL